jgi:hypothetical protein
MGQLYPDLVASGRIVQGYSVSGPLDPEMVCAIDRDLADQTWRRLFHDALRDNRRFQRGLFDLSHGMRIRDTMVPGPAALLKLVQDSRCIQPYSVQVLRALGGRPSEGYEHEYGFALVKTSASLWYTIRLAIQHDLEVATDSCAHYQLLERTCSRDKVAVRNHVMTRGEL